ncbi:MAG: UDP-N-acetylmuramoyl-tripeptide--D-alanyl-D-alanine ligase [Candidatus Delongbacteria bacterium]|jgi:UDP-N-acetylmuramoyl-tripeptide--D-alanyl-D-alanine ligase|nr:UDP-N-acetylmuramoyl-tripeptide--D-alanyl-D-alanine ligase [Candidatus Delongbacteria bacterium]
MNTRTLSDIFAHSEGVCTDTRNIIPGVIFFALKGDNFDGNKFAAEAIEKGAAYAVIDNADYQIQGKTVLVKDSLIALQKLAQLHRRKITAKIIAITGSNGKTTTKELFYSILKAHYQTTATSGNLNNHIGVPLSILNIKPTTEYGIIEMGANHPGEIARLCEISQPDFGLITNVGRAHIEGFGSFAGVKKAKAELYRYLEKTEGISFINQDNSLLIDLIGEQKTITYSFTSRNAFCHGHHFTRNGYVGIDWETDNMNGECISRLFGSYNAENILSAICMGAYLKVPGDKINKAIEHYTPGNKRSEIKITDKNELLLDMYNANPTSMELAIQHFYNKNKLQSMILGDMKELGNFSEQAHRDILDLVNHLGFNDVYLCGPEFYKFKAAYNYTFLPDTESLKQQIKKDKLNKRNILVKGSRAMQLEKILPYL